MTRAAHLALVLVLVVLSLMPSAAPVAAQQTLPQAFLGTWQGRADYSDYRWASEVTIALTGGTAGAVVGTIAYPTGLDRDEACGGNLVLNSVAADGSQVTFVEQITYGPDNRDFCSYADPMVSLTLRADGSLAYQWKWKESYDSSLTGTLTRTGGGTSGGGTSGGGTADGNDWCADLAATYGPASPSSGPWRGPLEQRQGTLTWATGGVWVSNFVATAIVYNPTTSTTTPWDFGFAFRQTADQEEVQQIMIASTGTWYYADYPNGVLASGDALSYSFSPGLPNTLDLVVDGDTASFCLNGQFVSTVQLPPAVASDVYLATGFFATTVVTGRVIDYERFAVWALPAT